MSVVPAIPGFTSLTPLGKGGVGDVYRAVRTSTNGVVAIKILRDIADQTGNWRRAQRELMALLQLKGHPNVIHVEEIALLSAAPVLVMEFASGGDVLTYMKQLGRPLTVSETAFVGAQITAALADAHRLGIVHRDVKPQNALITAFGQVKVCDFGIAAVARSEDFRERTSALSMRYASPEELDDAPNVGAPADVYSLGATLLHLVTGQSPTIRAPEAEVAIAVEPVKRHSELLAVTICACMRHDSTRRPTAAQLIEEFERIQAGLGVERSRALLVLEKPPAPSPTPPETIDSSTGQPLPDPGAAPKEWWH